MTIRSTRFVVSSLASSAVFALLTAGPAQAASECKGLEQAPCASTVGCSWTDSYTKKDGKTVAGYCRLSGKGAKGADVAAQGPAPTASPSGAATTTGKAPAAAGTGAATAPVTPAPRKVSSAPAGTATGATTQPAAK